MKEYEEEMSALDRAIRKERDIQISKMRRELLKRKIDQERAKKLEAKKSKHESKNSNENQRKRRQTILAASQ